jgi:hypothetical protein
MKLNNEIILERFEIHGTTYDYSRVNYHFDKNGNLRNKDIIRQKEIENLLQCKFIRIKQ